MRGWDNEFRCREFTYVVDRTGGMLDGASGIAVRSMLVGGYGIRRGGCIYGWVDRTRIEDRTDTEF